MDFFAKFVRIRSGKLQETIEVLTKIFGRGPGGKRGERRWIIYKDEPGWYDPGNAAPVVVILSFDFEQDKITKYLQEKGLAA